MKEKLSAILEQLINLSSTGLVRKVEFKKVPGRGFSIEIPQGTIEPQDVRNSLVAIDWGMIFNAEPSLYNGKIQSPSITIGPIKCLGNTSSTSDVDELLDFVS